MKPSFYNPDKEIPSLKGKVIFITGGNVGIGKETAIQLAKHSPAEVWIAARNAEKSKAAVNEIKSAASPGVTVRFLELDLSSFESVKRAARAFLASASRLDILYLNAGVMGGSPSAMTKEGYELRWGTNVMGHALLVKLFRPLLLKTAAAAASPADVRVICVCSDANWAPDFKWDSLKKPADQEPAISVVTTYAQSKLGNLAYGKQLAKHYPQFYTVSVNPGNVKTDLFTPNGGGMFIRVLNTFVRLSGLSVADGAKNHLWTGTSKDLVTGEYYTPVGVVNKGGSASAKDEKLAEELWVWIEKELEGHDI